MKRLHLIILLILTISINAQQITIGSSVAAEKAALLEIKDRKSETVGGVTSTTGGVIFPRVELTNSKELFPFFDVSLQNDVNYKTIQKPSHKGMFVYHIGTANIPAGVYVWSGTEWESFSTKPVIKPTITALQCNNASINPSVFSQGYTGILKIPYVGGNGGSYGVGQDIISQGNTGLTAKLQPGTLEYGSGELIFTLTGDPSSETIPAEFDIEFLEKTCKASVSGTVLGVGQTITFYTSTDLLNGQYLSSKYRAYYL